MESLSSFIHPHVVQTTFVHATFSIQQSCSKKVKRVVTVHQNFSFEFSWKKDCNMGLEHDGK